MYQKSVETHPQPVVAVKGPRHPALLAAVCVAAGVAIGDRLDWAPSVCAVIVVASGVVTALLYHHRQLLAVITIAAALAGIGAWRISVEQEGRPAPGLVELTTSTQPVEIFGRLDGVPVIKARGWRAPLELYAVGGHAGVVPIRARVLVSTPRSLAGFRLGDYLRFRAYVTAPFVRRNPGGFDYADYLFRQGIDATVAPVGELTHLPQPGALWSFANLVEPVRTWVRSALATELRPRAQALMLGFLLGDTDRLPEDVFDAFRESGTLHLLAVSGANVWLLVGMVAWPLWLLSVPRWPRTIILLVAVFGFSHLTRNEPSVVRAALMVGMILMGRLFGRPVHALNAVGVAALIILLVSPSHLFHVGFQLSFAAVIGIIIAIERMKALRPRLGRWGWRLAIPIVSSLAATLATAPISAWQFGSAPIMGVLANLVLVPLASLAAHLGIALLAAHAVWPTLAGWLAWPLEATVMAAIATAGFFASVPLAVVRWSHPTWFGVVNLCLGCVLALSWRHRYRWWRPAAYCATIMFVIVILRSTTREDSHLGDLALLDTGRQRVAALAGAGGEVTWLADDPGIDADLMQWVVAPFARVWFGAEPPTTWAPWRQTPETANPPVAGPASVTHQDDRCRWRRYTSALEGSEIGRRIWADRLATPTDTVILVRDLPDGEDGLCARLAADIGPGHVLVLPFAAPTRYLRRAIDTLRPSRVVLFGNEWRGKRPDERLTLWQVRYPGIEFFATPVHGGIIITCERGGTGILPTLPGDAAGSSPY